MRLFHPMEGDSFFQRTGHTATVNITQPIPRLIKKSKVNTIGWFQKQVIPIYEYQLKKNRREA